MSLKSAIKTLGVGLAVVAVTAPAVAQFPPVVARLSNRPAMNIETNYYAYGPGVGFTDPEVFLTVEANGYAEPATLWVYWQDRETGTTRYLNNCGFQNSPIDVFGSTGTPRRIVVANLGDMRIFGDNSACGPLPNNIPSSTGRYQFVAELRDADGRQTISRANALYNHVDGVVTHNGSITSNETWDSDDLHFLAGPTFIERDVTVNVEAGAVVLGSQSGQGTLVARQASTLNLNGEVNQPIIMSSEREAGRRGAGNWGGLVYNGRAPTNQGTSPNPEGEGNSGQFGGNVANDSSGRIQYVRVEFAGIRFSTQNELNGIALQGVGSDTVLDHVQVHFNQDDGIEFFGGTVDAKFVLITAANDDSIDWTFGWNGRMQHAVVLHCGNREQDNGIEADNFESVETASPISNPTIHNATFAGDSGHLPEASDDGVNLRRGSLATIKKAIFANFTDNGVQIDGNASTAALSGNGILFEETLLFNNGTNANVALGPLGDVSVGDPGFYNDPIGRVGCGVVPDPTCANCDGASRSTGAFFDAAPWIGGVNPDDSWIDDGWTAFPDN